MQLNLTIDIPNLPNPITYTQNILLIGSCFTEHIADRLTLHKFNLLSNPHGILFNPLSVANSIDGYLAGKQYREDELFYLNEIWNSWEHHTRFSDTDQQMAMNGINESQRAATDFIAKADWVIITLGSAFQYYLKENGKPVANNHRAPAQWFVKQLLSITEIFTALQTTLQKLFVTNPKVQVLFTISPVRHIRDGVIENNRSKARLIEVVHELVNNNKNVHYFPAYEIIIDVLRDYRFYDIDLVHPNFLATNIVWEHFVKSCIAPNAHEIMKQVQEITTARNHLTRFPNTNAHKKFKQTYLEKMNFLSSKYPFLDFDEEVTYFSAV